MQVKLKVIGGKNDGREIKISIPEFIIGRGEEAHLRPSSDLISRHHCSLKIENGSVIISDMGSRNGTYVNGQKIDKPHVAKVGDTLRVGRLQFELLIDHVQPGNKKPKVQGVAEAAARTASSAANGELDDESITDWLTQPADEDDSTKSLSDTQHFSLEETPTRMFVRSDEISDSTAETIMDDSESSAGRKSKSAPKKLPVRPSAKAESSKSAADEVLRKFFNRR